MHDPSQKAAEMKFWNEEMQELFEQRKFTQRLTHYLDSSISESAFETQQKGNRDIHALYNHGDHEEMSRR